MEDKKWRSWVLVFPPFNNFRRCLIHQIVENNFDNLKSFSIGEGEERRTVVCFDKDFKSTLTLTQPPKTDPTLPSTPESFDNQPISNTPGESGQESKKRVKRVRTMPSVSIYRPPAARKLEQNANLSSIQRDVVVVENSSPEKNKLKCTEEPRDANQNAKRTESNGMSVFRNAITSIRTQNQVPKCKSNVESTNRKNEADTKMTKQEEGVKGAVQSRQRRPDIQVYVPKGRRTANLSNADAKVSVSPVREEKARKTSEPAVPEKEDIPHSEAVETAKVKEKPPADEPETKAVAQVPETKVTQNDTQNEPVPVSDSKSSNSSQGAESSDSNSVNSTTSSSCEKTSENKNSKKRGSGGQLNPEECDWETMFDDSGECLDPSLLDQLTNAVGEVTIEKPKSGYNGYKTKSLDMVADEFPHVIEIYNFPPEFQLQDLMTVFSQFKNSGFEIKWVDDTHALGIFSSSAIVSEVLSFYHPFVKTRSLKEGTPLSKMKARRSAEFLLPYKPRPDTCPALARRLVTGALGVRLPTSREEREAEKKILTKAREKKRLEAKQKEDAWEGTFS